MPELQLEHTVVQRRSAPDDDTLLSPWQKLLESNPHGETKCTMLLTAEHICSGLSPTAHPCMHANVMDAASRTGCRKSATPYGSEGVQLTLSSGTQQ